MRVSYLIQWRTRSQQRKETKETVPLIPRLEFCLPIKSEFWKTPHGLSFLINVNLSTSLIYGFYGVLGLELVHSWEGRARPHLSWAGCAVLIACIGLTESLLKGRAWVHALNQKSGWGSLGFGGWTLWYTLLISMPDNFHTYKYLRKPALQRSLLGILVWWERQPFTITTGSWGIT